MNNEKIDQKSYKWLFILYLIIIFIGTVVAVLINQPLQPQYKNDSLFSQKSIWFNNSSYIQDTMMEIRAAGRDYNSSKIRINKKYITNYSEDHDYIYIELNISVMDKKQRD